MANCEEPPTGRVQTEGCSWEASSDGDLREEKGARVGVSAEADRGHGIRGATRPQADQAAASRPFPGRGPARGGERAGERALTGRCRAA